MNRLIELHQVDDVEIITIVDNVIEGSGSSLHDNVIPVQQWVSGKGSSPSFIYAGHGIANLIRTHIKGKSFEVLYDTGPSGELLLHNLKALNLDPTSIDAIVMSHGHWDHFGGLISILEAIGRNKVPVYLHPRMLVRRRIAEKDGMKKIRELPPVCNLSDITDAGGEVKMTTEPILIAGDSILRTGEIPRETEFEKGFPNHEALVEGKWVDDSEIIDDNCLAVRTKDGLIIITGCAHAGVVNSTNEVIRLTGIKRVHAIIGGFHLIGRQNKPRIENTIEALKMHNPTMIVPCHCTGAEAQHMIANAFPLSYVTGCVGNMYKF